MTQIEADNIIEILINEFGTRFEMDSDKKIYWESELSQYDFDDVIKNLKPLLSDRTYALKGPNLAPIVKGLTRTSEKVDFTKLTWFCSFCRRPFNEHAKLIEHEDRCRSIEYIERKYKQYNFGDINRKELYDMTDEEFQKNYKKLLKIIHDTTTNESEKNRIEMIFNPLKEKLNFGGRK